MGRRYESLDVLECVNNSLESVPTPYYTQRHEKKYHDITILQYIKSIVADVICVEKKN